MHAFITGAASGIGAATALWLARRGPVALADRDADGPHANERTLAINGGPTWSFGEPVDDDWHASLRRIGAGLVPGGRLVFETRNPVRRAWEGWQQDPTERTMPAGRVLESERTSAPDRHGVVTMRVRTEFLDSGEVSEVDQHLQFRSVEQVTEDLTAAGLAVDRVWSDWHGRPFDAAEHPLMIIEACPQGA